MVKRLACVFICFALLCGCKKGVVLPKALAASAEISGQEYTDRDIYYGKKDYSLNKLEKDDMIYTGADIAKDAFYGESIAKFERQTVSQDIYSYEIRLNESFPIEWILKCIAENKIPLITIMPPVGGNMFSIAEFERLAEEMDVIDTAMFIELYPDGMNSTPDRERFLAFYRTAVNTFKRKTEKAAFIYSLSAENAQSARLYYPGDDYADWIGFRFLQGDSADLWSALDFVYYSFQKTKPIIITQLGFINFSFGSNSYTTLEAGDNINSFYEKTAADYPRIRAVIYSMENNVYNGNKKYSYSISGLSELNACYINAVKTLKQAGDGGSLMKSPFKAKVCGGKIYVNEKTLIHDFAAKAEGKSILIDTEVYFELEDINIGSHSIENGRLVFSGPLFI